MVEPTKRGSTGTHLTQACLQDLVSVTRSNFGIPAIAATLLDAQAIRLQEYQGLRCIDQAAEISAGDFFHIGSCAKSVLALIAARLVEQGSIAWNSTFLELYPELTAASHEDYRDITLQDLLLCRAGIKAYTDAATEPFPDFDASVTDPVIEFIGQLLSLSPVVERTASGFQHRYSNASYTMAAAMLKRVTGSSWEEMIGSLEDALELRFHVGWPNTISADQPWGHRMTGDHIETYPPGHDYRLPSLIAPAGDLSMTSPDFARYTQLHLRGLRGENRYVSGENFRHLHYGFDGFSLGVGNGMLENWRYSWLEGSAGTFFCRAIIVAEADFAFTVMSNVSTDRGSMESIDWLSQEIITRHFNWR